MMMMMMMMVVVVNLLFTDLLKGVFNVHLTLNTSRLCLKIRNSKQRSKLTPQNSYVKNGTES
jgi:hypothetical protein